MSFFFFWMEINSIIKTGKPDDYPDIYLTQLLSELIINVIYTDIIT